MNLTDQQIRSLLSAGEHIKQGEFERAGEIYDSLAKALRGKPPEILVLFNAGSAYRSAGQCETSLARYLRLLDRTLNQKALKTRALLEISFSYECLGKERLSFLSLRDAGAFRNQLSPEIQKTVYPARLGMAYARMGKKDKGADYQSLALRGILSLRSQYSSEKELTADISRLFFFMGKSYTLKTHINPQTFIPAFSHHQLYLLQGAFLKDAVWSERAKKELSFLFERLEQALTSPKEREKHKNSIFNSLKRGETLCQNEGDSSLVVFYKTQTKKIKSLFN